MKQQFLILILLISALSFTREVEGSNNTELLTEHAFSGGIVVHNRGIGGDLTYFRQLTADRYSTYSLGLRSQRHPKEIRLITQVLSQERMFTYGKQNSFYTINLMYGQRQALTRAYEHRDVIIDLHYRGGVSFGILKPVYLEIIKIEPGADERSLSTEKYAHERHNEEDIYGKAGFTHGFGGLSPMIGGSFQTGIGFQWNRKESSYRHLEAGVSIDAFPSEIPIFAKNTDNPQMFFNIYLKYSVGKNW